MAGTVRLRHTLRKNDWSFYHYTGVVPVKQGVIELPADNFTLVRRAFVMGFRQTEDGQPISPNQFSDIVAKATTDSSEEQDSGKRTSRGRQPRTTDRVRESESDSSGDTAGSGS